MPRLATGRERSLLLGPLNHLNSVAQQLLQSLSPPHTKPPLPPSINALAEADAALASAVQLAHIHQNKQKRIEALESDVLALENSWRNVIVQLEEGRRDLEVIIAEGDVRLDAIEQAKAGAIPYPELLAYAQSLSAFTSAPPNLPDLSLPGQPPPPLFFPPFPNEEKMRRGHLNAEEPLGPLGETHSVGRRECVSSADSHVHDASPHRGQAANPYRPMDNRPPQQIFDLDLDLNPDL
ncbi:vitamin-D-receptor interacting mediator subunit 4-domain-containing protein [Lactarius akahatsu]|uniref:Mediator of RNA polymerase II transcription subunit 4 n=1 Tax=Lactarius akahatsu TaxID=416441 RepID=A0AAD4QD02_9AGAM|nr:vitamin-D-receptor interacting mediator subunit 4-domain-containing protein [Lactarius akahatsu]